jgi:hypothetical protein
MKADIKERWLTALRSGEFKQTDGYLAIADNDGNPKAFCCLGVLCEIAVQDGVIGRKLSDDFNISYAGNGSDLPAAVVAWAGLEDLGTNARNPEVRSYHVHSDKTCGGTEEIGHQCDFADDSEDYKYPLSALNDDHKWNFNQIADVIEKDL